MMIQDDHDKEPAEMGRFAYRLFSVQYLCSKLQGFEMNPQLFEISILILAFQEEVKLLH